MKAHGRGAILTITADSARLALPKVGSFGIACAVGRGPESLHSSRAGPHEIRVVCLRSIGSQTLPPRGRVETSPTKRSRRARSSSVHGRVDAARSAPDARRGRRRRLAGLRLRKPAYCHRGQRDVWRIADWADQPGERSCRRRLAKRRHRQDRKGTGCRSTSMRSAPLGPGHQY